MQVAQLPRPFSLFTNCVRNYSSKPPHKESRKGQSWWKRPDQEFNKGKKTVFNRARVEAAVREGNIAGINQFLAQNEELRKRGDTGLMLAAMFKGKKLMDQFLLQGEDAKYKNELGLTPLHYTCAYDFSRGAETLLEAGADVNAQDELGQTPMHEAALNGAVRCASVFIEHGANLEIQDSHGDPPLHTAARFGGWEVATVLLNNNANINKKNQKGETPLHCAAKHNESRCLKLFLEQGAALEVYDARGATPLLAAASNSDDIDCVTRLIAAGADVNATLPNRFSALHFAAQHGNLPAVKALIAAGAMLDGKATHEDFTPLMLAAMHGQVAVADHLIYNGARIDLLSTDGMSALHFAAHNPIFLTTYLMYKGVDVNGKDNAEHTALHYAVGELDDDPKSTELLLEAGADVNMITPDEKSTPLHMAVFNENPRIAAALMSAGANINAVDILGKTPLHLAVEADDLEMVKLLCQHTGLDHLIAAPTAGTALQVAARLGHDRLIPLLQKFNKTPTTQPPPDKKTRPSAKIDTQNQKL